ncbi:unnamed protein product [Symbiodinium natans]|uniref:Uncharacterized protein n=1 Tax=Symbiodinium natans TaxID=878477 RepID=A0A812L615_9DINO|nr:unnamed protein product [Symbiodinium natans]
MKTRDLKAFLKKRGVFVEDCFDMDSLIQRAAATEEDWGRRLYGFILCAGSISWRQHRRVPDSMSDAGTATSDGELPGANDIEKAWKRYLVQQTLTERFLADTFQPLLQVPGLRLILPQAPQESLQGQQLQSWFLPINGQWIIDDKADDALLGAWPVDIQSSRLSSQWRHTCTLWSGERLPSESGTRWKKSSAFSDWLCRFAVWRRKSFLDEKMAKVPEDPLAFDPANLTPEPQPMPSTQARPQSAEDGGVPTMDPQLTLKLLNDQEIADAAKDPEGMAVIQDVIMDPSNLELHKKNPRVADLVAKLETGIYWDGSRDLGQGRCPCALCLGEGGSA